MKKKVFKLFLLLVCINISFSLASCGKKSYDVSGLKFENEVLTYDAKAHSIEIKGDLPEGVTVEYQNNNQTNVGSYEVVAKLYGDGDDSLVEDMTATLTINKAKATIICNDITAEYGDELKSLTYKTEGIASSDLSKLTVDLETNAKPEVGEYEITASNCNLTDNYDIEYKSGTYTVGKRELDIAFSGETNILYDGKEHKEVTATILNLVGADTLDVNLTYSGNMIDEGDYTVTATIADNPNYKLTENNVYNVSIVKEIFTVTFIQENHDNIVKTVKYNDTLTDIPTPQEIEGYTVTWDKNDFSNIKENITVHSIKTPNKYKVTLHNNLEEAETIELTATYDEQLYIPSSFSLDGYSLENWNSSINELFGNEFKYQFPMNLDLYAYWTTELSAELDQNNKTALVSNSTDSNVVIPRYYYSQNDETKIFEKYEISGFTNDAFKNNKTINSIDFADNCQITTIGKAFYGCTNLTSITLPENLTAINNTSAFYNCKLSSITINSKNLSTFGDGTKYHSIFGGSYLQSIRLIIGDTCEVIPAYFSVNIKDKLTHIQTSTKTTLKEIGAYAFNGVELNHSISLPNSLEIIKESAFSSFDSNISIDNCNKLTTIESQAFFSANITSITLPDSVKYIGEKVFYLSDLEFFKINTTSTLEEIGKWAFLGTGIGDITIPSTIKIIGEEAFKACDINITVPFASNNVPSGFSQYWIDKTNNNIIYQTN